MAGHEVERRWDWPESPRWSSLRSLVESTFEGVDPIRIEETVEDDQLVVQAELPGIDPDRDVEISVQERTPHIRAERRQETKQETPGRRHSEFRYGSFARRLPLPDTYQTDGRARGGDCHLNFHESGGNLPYSGGRVDTRTVESGEMTRARRRAQPKRRGALGNTLLAPPAPPGDVPVQAAAFDLAPSVLMDHALAR